MNERARRERSEIRTAVPSNDGLETGRRACVRYTWPGSGALKGRTSISDRFFFFTAFRLCYSVTPCAASPALVRQYLFGNRPVASRRAQFIRRRYLLSRHADLIGGRCRRRSIRRLRAIAVDKFTNGIYSYRSLPRNCNPSHPKVVHLFGSDTGPFFIDRGTFLRRYWNESNFVHSSNS